MHVEHPLVTLTSDFGSGDSYVGVMKGVILRICPSCRLVDLAHSIPQGDILKASFALRSAVKYFPAGTVHLAVVDPGVGGSRLPVAIHAGNMYFVGPDNGLFWFLAEQDPPSKTVILENAGYTLPSTSTTFHGRDVFAPVAAHLASGVGLEELGPPLLKQLVTPSLPQVEWIGNASLRGHVIYVDHFGNCVSNILPEEVGCDLSGSWVVELRDYHPLPIGSYYGQVDDGSPIALIGSSGNLEIAVRNGSAAKKLNLDVGTAFLLKKSTAKSR